tara:strand:- start:806 stop:1609 length:804 start_codon:yes stop_codon:yes gene_type:complete
MAGKVIGVMNEKGGVGKTTVSTQLAFELADRGNKVCFVDNDPQNNGTSAFFGDEAPDAISSADPSVSVALTERLYQREGFSPVQVLDDNENLWLLGASDGLALLESEDDEEELLESFCDSIELLTEAFDYIIIDNGPSFNRKFTSAILASTSGGVLLPMAPDYDPLRGVKRVAARIDTLKEDHDIEVPVLGILINLWKTNPVTQVARCVKEEAEEHFGDLMLSTVLHEAEDLRKAKALQERVGHLVPRSKATKQMASLVDELVARIK